MSTNSENVNIQTAISAAIPEIFYNFRVFSFNESVNKNSKINEGEYNLNGWKIDKWHFDKMNKIYNELNEKGNMKVEFEEVLERLSNRQFDYAEKLGKKIYDLIEGEYLIFGEVYNEEEYLSVDVERVYNKWGWEGIGEIVSIVTITLDNLHSTYQTNSPTRPINFNLINLNKLNFTEEEIKKLNSYVWYYALKTSLNLSKERGKNNINLNLNFEKTDYFNWDILIKNIKIYGIRNQINFYLKEKFTYTKPPKLEMIEEDEMAPIIKGVRGAKEMCPVCSSLNVKYDMGLPYCEDCGWSTCSFNCKYDN